MRTRQRAGRTIRSLVDAFRRPQWVSPGHFYSPINSREDVERALNWNSDAPGVDLREDHQIELFRQLLPLFDGVPDNRYEPVNPMYGPADALVYQAMLRRFRPSRVVEVGSGFSTAKLLDTADVYLPDVEVTCVEPYPDRLRSLLKSDDRVDIIAAPVQDAPLDLFTSLMSSDIVFIDSTHVAKAGSDVLWLFLRVLPRLAPGVLVHVHDVFWPFEYPAEWLTDGRNWNEDYLLNAFLCHNDTWLIELFSSWIWQRHSELVPSGLRGGRPGSIWLRRG